MNKIVLVYIEEDDQFKKYLVTLPDEITDQLKELLKDHLLEIANG